MYIRLQSRNIDRELYVDYDFTQGGDGWNEPYWRELRIESVWDTYVQDSITYHGKEISDIITRADDMYKLHLWDKISQLINEKI